MEKAMTFTASATVKVTGFDSARDGERVTRYLGDALGEALSVAVRGGRTASDPITSEDVNR